MEVSLFYVTLWACEVALEEEEFTIMLLVSYKRKHYEEPYKITETAHVL